MLYINSISWLKENEYGNSKKSLKKFEQLNEELNLMKNELFEKKVSNFGRFDISSRKACLLSKILISELNDFDRLETGIIGVGDCGSKYSDINYFNDFIEHNEESGRSNLFIYTLPTSPMAETSIYFKLEGPLLFLTFEDFPIHEALIIAINFIKNKEAKQMFIIQTEKDNELEGFALCIGEKTDSSICPISQIDFKKSSLNIMKDILELNLGLNRFCY